MLLSIFIFYQQLYEYRIYTLATSSPFERQEIDDGNELNDWIFWPSKDENTDIQTINNGLIEIPFGNKSDCKVNSKSPQIQSVSYLSDGKKLNVTLWLSSGLLEDLLVADTINNTNYKSNGNKPLWKNVKFNVVIDVISTFNKGVDYRFEFSRNLNNNNTFQWQEKLYEVSIDGTYKQKIIKEYDQFPFDRNNALDFYIDLNSISNPSKYNILSYVTDLYVKNGKYCRMVDTTNWILIPPPEFQIKVVPSYLEMRPDDKDEVLVVIKGNTEIDAEGILNTNFADKKYAFVEFRSNTTSISKFSNGTSALSIRIPNSLTKEDIVGSSKLLFIPIYANISFPTTITSNDGNTYINNNSISLSKSANLTVNVLPPLELADHIENITKTLKPIGEIWQIVVAIGTGIASFFIYLYKKKKDGNVGGINADSRGDTKSISKQKGALMYGK